MYAVVCGRSFQSHNKKKNYKKIKQYRYGFLFGCRVTLNSKEKLPVQFLYADRLVNRCYCNRTYVFIQLFYLMRSGMGYIISQLQIESCYCSKNKQNFVSEKVGFLVAPP